MNIDNNNITILWLDDVRNPLDYFKPTPARLKSSAYIRNKNFYDDNIFRNYNPKFIWVKNYDEFTKYILSNGLPNFISFDRDLKSGNGIPKGDKYPYPDGEDCARWLVEYCKNTGQQLPKCFAHSANSNGQKNIGNILGLNENNNVKNENIMKIKKSQLTNIIKESIKRILNEEYFNSPDLDDRDGLQAFIRGVKENVRYFMALEDNGETDLLSDDTLKRLYYEGSVYSNSGDVYIGYNEARDSYRIEVISSMSHYDEDVEGYTDYHKGLAVARAIDYFSLNMEQY